MGKKLYVGNLPYAATEQALSEAFAQCGTVESVKIITDRETGRSRGFGFVEMPDKAEAQSAIQNLNGKELRGQQMNVNEARPRPDRGKGGRPGGQGKGRGFGGGGRHAPSRAARRSEVSSEPTAIR